MIFHSITPEIFEKELPGAVLIEKKIMIESLNYPLAYFKPLYSIRVCRICGMGFLPCCLMVKI